MLRLCSLSGKGTVSQQGIYEKPTTNIILNGEKLKALSLRSGKIQAHPWSKLLFHIGLKVFAIAVSKEK